MTEKASYLVDSNILLPYFAKDHAEHSPASKRLIQAAVSGRVELHIALTTVAETIYTLRSHYRREKNDVCENVLTLLSSVGVKTIGPSWIRSAVEEFQSRGASFGDACIAAEARARKMEVASFDTGFDKMVGVKRFEPK